MSVSLDAVVLAAGQGSRFGGDKLLAVLRGRPLIDLALQAAFASPVDRVRLVVGPGGEDIAAAGRAFAREVGREDMIDIVIAEDAVQGLSRSLRAGVAAASHQDGVLVFLGDMPFISPLAASAVCGRLAEGAVAAATISQGRRGHPVGLSRALFPQVALLEGDRGAGALLDRLGGAVALTPVAHDTLRDIDTRGDLADCDGA